MGAGRVARGMNFFSTNGEDVGGNTSHRREEKRGRGHAKGRRGLSLPASEKTGEKRQGEGRTAKDLEIKRTEATGRGATFLG